MANDMMNNELREKFAELCHKQWSEWMWYMLSKVTLTNKTAVDYRERWWHQMNTRYENLTEEEKESDRKLADAFIITLE